MNGRKVDPITGIVEIKKRIKLSEIEANPHEPFELHILLGMTEPRRSDIPIEVFDKRRAGDTYQIIDGHRRVIAARKRGDKTIEAWITLKRRERKSLLGWLQA